MSQPPAVSEPSWPHCGQDADPSTEPVGCHGIHVPGHTACLAHLPDADRHAYLHGLSPGADIDHRGTPFTQSLLADLLDALRDPTTGNARLGHAVFTGARFSDDAWFNGARFVDSALFGGAQFFGRAWFNGARFSELAWFEGAEFSGGAMFEGARFSGHAQFEAAQFFRHAWFETVQFSGGAGFGKAQFSRDVRFGKAQFPVASVLGPLVCAGAVDLASVVFGSPVTLEIAAREVRCTRTRWAATATVRLRYAQIDLEHAELSAPLAITAHPAPFVSPGVPFERRVHVVDESLLSGCPDGVRVASVQGVDAAHLVLTNTDLAGCRFSGTFNLDQLRLGGRTLFAAPPTGWHHRGMRLTRWTRRRTLAEEHHWRAQTAGQSAPPPGNTTSSRQWHPGPHHPDPSLTPVPEDVSALYRQLRKAFEDSKNAPGAADFYYGECEMRRHDHTSTPTGERHLLWAYWLLSGYGLRASRAFTWLLTAMTLTVLLLTGYGLPDHAPRPATTGTVKSSNVSLTTSNPRPTLHGGLSQHITTPRVEKAIPIAVNSVVFRSSGQNLTVAGSYIEIFSRLLEPTLLALGLLAIRGRIKR
ncbi:pentapeptide repeat-containing protein [Streptomyces sp. NPDC051597]|uniref:pentapeptide repeat-containing protein n=1 Tax=Streptomyces sp. NPDC051597 TaxID=3155049 RepID=UPI0034392B23